MYCHGLYNDRIHDPLVFLSQVALKQDVAVLQPTFLHMVGKIG